MTRAQAGAAAFLAAGLVAGSLAPAPSHATPPVTAGGEHVLQADFHVHAFPGDGFLAPWDLLREARRQRLDAIVITNHNQVLAARLGVWVQRNFGGPLVLVGDEVTAPGYHLSAAGIREPVDWRGPASEAIAQVHAQGGIVVAAHPTKRYWSAYDDASLRALDGTEVAHPLSVTDPDGSAEIVAFHTRALQARRRPLSPVGSSDFHMLSAMGLCRTFVFAREPTVAGLLQAVREGRTVAQGPDGALFGDAARREFVEASGAGARPARTRAEATAAVAAWLGLAALLIFGRGPGS